MSKALRQGRNLFGGVGSNPTLVTSNTKQNNDKKAPPVGLEPDGLRGVLPGQPSSHRSPVHGKYFNNIYILNIISRARRYASSPMAAPSHGTRSRGRAPRRPRGSATSLATRRRGAGVGRRGEGVGMAARYVIYIYYIYYIYLLYFIYIIMGMGMAI